MTAEQAQREPTMEEILASIRRIISEEDKPDEAGSDVLELQPQEHMIDEPPAPAPAAVPEPEPAFEVAAHVARNSTPSRALEDDFMIVESEEDEAPPTPEPARAPPTAELVRTSAPPRSSGDDGLVSEPTAAKAAGALGKLMGSMLVSSGSTLDDVVRELLKPMLKEWLDAHLPAIVEAEVEKEIDRIRRLAR